ncbi:MAG: ABC transporter permease [Oscillospiraceae bacterium]|nr:ABC transporter permease [Oscillospiraceae bacterium]
MKKLNYSTMAAARLRANKRQYLNLMLGIFLSIFMVSTLVLSIWGIYQAQLQKRHDMVGYVDMVMLESPKVTDGDLRSFAEIDRIGHAYISGIVTDNNVYLGYYDGVGMELMNLVPTQGRLPEAMGEIAVEASAMDVLDVSWELGQTVELDITPVDGTAERRSFTLVGILPERSVYLGITDHSGLNQFPAIVTHAQEPAFATGRIGIHYLMGLSQYATVNQAILAFWDTFQGWDGVIGDFYGLSITGEQMPYAGIGGFVQADREMLTLIVMVCILAGALILSCGVGIAGAMEGVLAKRQEEIGVLRALGATRRQIRRMFGRENLVLALIASPLSILISMGAVWLLSTALPGSMKFAVNLWLIVPIVAFSILVILLSGYLPLVRASKQMPMGVIRDTAVLRRGKGIKPKKEFSATKLIAARQVRLNPTRQMGASVLVGLTLLCAGLLCSSLVSFADYTRGEKSAFQIEGGGVWHYEDHMGQIINPSLDQRSISQIRKLNHVESIKIDRRMTASVLLDHVPSYALVGMGDSQMGMLSDEQFEKAMEYKAGSADYWRQYRKQERESYLKFLEDYHIPGEAFHISLVTLDLNSRNLDKLKPYVESGKINVDAIHAGKEVLVVAPEMWRKPNENGTGMYGWYSEEAVKNDPNGEGAFLAAWNDSFVAGEQVQLLQLYRREMEGAVNRLDVSPVIGAVLSQDIGLISGGLTEVAIITSEQGLENMGFPMEGLWRIEVYLDGDISLEEEELLERQLEAIARRNEGYSVWNVLESFRQRETARKQEMLLYAAIAVVFFSVSVGMIVSSVTRQLDSEGRTIGMLRAVGADERAILRCYSGRITASVLGGMGICFVLLLLYFLVCVVDAIARGYFLHSELTLIAVFAATVTALGLFCLVVCKFLLRFRIREIVRKSIIENIREL